MTGPQPRNDLAVLLRLDRQRAASLFRHPTAAATVGLLLPLLGLAVGLVLLGRYGAPGADGFEGGVNLGLLAAGAIAFLAYGTLFTTADRTFLREIGIDPAAVFFERGLRLGALALGGGIAAGVPFAAAGLDPIRPAAIAFTAGAVAAGVASLMYAAAAGATVGRGGGAFLRAGLAKFDRGLGRAAPLVYAPLPPFLAGAVAGGVAGSNALSSWLPPTIAAAIALGGAAAAGRSFAGSAPRFLPRVGEMAYTPPPERGGETFRVGTGLSALLPRAAAAVWVRDATLAGRRYSWAARVSWPVGIASVFALARWGAEPATRAWVLSAVGVALGIQAAAVLSLGLLERAGPRWLDRSLGVRWPLRFIGRWAWAWGLSLWLLLPVGLAWSFWAGGGSFLLWPIAGALTAAIATLVSLLNAQRR